MSILNRRRVSSASAFGGSRPTPTPVRAGTTVEDDRGYEIMRRMSAVSPIPDQTPTSPLPPSAEEPADFFIDTSLSLSRASRAGSWLESSSSNDGVGGPMSPTTGSTGMGGAGLSSSGNTKMLQAHFKSRLGRDGAVYPAPSPPPSTGINGSTDMSGPGAVSSVASPPMSPLSTAMPKLPPLPTAIDASAGSSNVQPLTLTITGLTSSSSAQAPAPAKSPATFEPSMQEIEAWHLTHKPPKEIRSMRFSFNSSTTSATIDPATMFQDVHRVLMFVSRMYNGNLKYSRVPDYYMFRCEMPDAETPDVPLEFEVEICKVWLLKVHGLRMKRISGNVFAFKDIYSQFVADLHWT
ncbi:hypothetical protein BC831DRAFT_455857 [Entophlyctis helioformis]|nr:hypothetical protein BC831DRAFT_455857 [Entophlyctis helioformis]